MFRGSATTLNSLYPGIDLMISLVLSDGEISFIGIQVEIVGNEDYIDPVIQNALEKVKFNKMFPNYSEKFGPNNRPFVLIVLIFGKYSFEIFTPILKKQSS
jgi:hypothetical protein